MNKSLFLLLASLALLPSAMTARDYSRLHLSDVEVSLSEDHHALNMKMTVDPAAWRMPLNRYVTITPVIRAEASADTLAPITLAGKNMYYSLLRAGKTEGSLLRGGKGEPVTYSVTVPMERWMTVSDIDFSLSTTGCCGNADLPDEDLPVAHIDLTPAQLSLSPSYMEPAPAPKDPRHISGKAYVVFPVNKTYIDPMYEVDGQRPNIRELGKITASIDTVRLNRDATVTKIKLTGFASPEGPYDNNVRLAQGRTEAVKEYVRKSYDFPASIYETASVPEDWAGLRDSVAASFLPDRAEMLRFIDDPSIKPAERNDRFMKAFPESYKYLLEMVYPWLRHTNYDITYTIREYDDINEIMHVLATAPANLSLREFYLAANTLEVGSPEYDDVWLKAVLMNPDDPTANINAAYAYINRGNMKDAARHLAKAGDSAGADFARSLFEAKSGNYDKALELLQHAQAAGHPKAAEAIAEIRRVTSHRPGITYKF